jgi:hypothetical protein
VTAAAAEDICQQIGQLVAKTVPQPWQTARIHVRFQNGVISAEGTYTRPQESTQHSFPVPGAINHLFMQLRQLVKKDDQNLWTGATFIVEADGRFTIDFEY